MSHQFIADKNNTKVLSTGKIMLKFLESLITVSEKAANIARTCRQEEHLFNLLVEEKVQGDANPRFVQDFKTLADVLIQECVRHDIGNLFPSIAPHIRGEENNVFCNTLGETIRIEIQADVDGTAVLLEKVLDGDKKAAYLLAQEVHRDVRYDDLLQIDGLNVLEIDVGTLGVWIDPIDSTAEYINAKEHKNSKGIYTTGLQCVTVLIGVYERDTGVPIIGVVNQPFHAMQDASWRGRCFWGVSTSDFNRFSSTIRLQPRNNTICVSSSENKATKSLLQESKYKYDLVEAAGAGYKILTVITGQADAYFLSKNSTFKWDTCGPQAILKSIGGNIINFKDLQQGTLQNVEYKDRTFCGNKIDKYCNENGIIAFRNVDVVNELIEIFS